MCQAYDSERNFIVRGEEAATRAGYAAAKAGEPRKNPHYKESYDYKAWEHGYGCFLEGIVPYAVEKVSK